MSHWGNYEISISLKSNKPLVKEVIHCWCEQEPILAIQPFLIRRVAPRLAMTRAQMLLLCDASYPTRPLERHHPLLEEPLASASHHYSFFLGLSNLVVSLNLSNQMLFPLKLNNRGMGKARLAHAEAQHQSSRFCANKVNKRCGKSIRQIREVNTLHTYTVRA